MGHQQDDLTDVYRCYLEPQDRETALSHCKVETHAVCSKLDIAVEDARNMTHTRFVRDYMAANRPVLIRVRSRHCSDQPLDLLCDAEGRASLLDKPQARQQLKCTLAPCMCCNV